MKAWMITSLMMVCGVALADPVADCQRAMAVRPMPVATGPALWGDMIARARQADDMRRAAVALCETDPYAHLKPLPWERSAPVESHGAVCFVQSQVGGGSVVVCP